MSDVDVQELGFPFAILFSAHANSWKLGSGWKKGVTVLPNFVACKMLVVGCSIEKQHLVSMLLFSP